MSILDPILGGISEIQQDGVAISTAGTQTLNAGAGLVAAFDAATNTTTLTSSAVGTDWEAFTPAFTSSNSDASLGNGTISGFWRQVGDSIQFQVTVVFGTTTDFGTGYLELELFDGLPAPARVLDSTKTGGRLPGSGHLVDNSAPVSNAPLDVHTGSTSGRVSLNAWLGGAGFCTAAVPITWATGDYITFDATAPWQLAGG